MTHRAFSGLVTILSVTLLLTGCGDDSTESDTTSQAAGSGSKTSPQADAPETSGTTTAAATNEKAEPIQAADFPKPEGAGESIMTADTSTVMFHMEGNVDTLVDFYTAELEKLGWKKDPGSEIADGVAFLDFTKGKLSITVTLNPGDTSVTTIAQGSGIHVPETADDGDDSKVFGSDDAGADNE